AKDRPHFMNAVIEASGGRLVPVPGGGLIKEGNAVMGAVGVSGDSSDNDEAAAVAGGQAARPPPGLHQAQPALLSPPPPQTLYLPPPPRSLHLPLRLPALA